MSSRCKQSLKDSYDHPTAAYKILLNNHFINPLSVESGCKYSSRTSNSPNVFRKKITTKSQLTELQE